MNSYLTMRRCNFQATHLRSIRRHYCQETATIIGTTTPGFDLSGILYFNEGAKFRIIDRRQFHTGQPVFIMHSNQTLSFVSSRTLNPVIGPKLLSYSAATVILKDKAEEVEIERK